MISRVLFIVLARNDEDRVADSLSTLTEMVQTLTGLGILLIDDASDDQTLNRAQDYVKEHPAWPIRLMSNPLAQGDGGNWKAGFRYAIDRGFDVVIPLSAHETYSPQAIAALLHAIEEQPDADCVLGHARIRSFFPWAIQRVLCGLQNKLAQSRLRTWHTLYRAYRTRGLAEIAFELDSNQIHFDTEVLLQFIAKNLPIEETALPIPQGFYSRHLYRLSYAKEILKATLKYRLQKYNLFYDVRYHPKFFQNELREAPCGKIYQEKFDMNSPHSFVCNDPELIPRGSTVLDIGCSMGYVAKTLAQTKGCKVTGVDLWPVSQFSDSGFAYHQVDIEKDFEKLKCLIEEGQFDVILLLDIIEHLAVPEKFLLGLYKIRSPKRPKLVFSTPNVAFAPIRMMLLLGYFNYGEKGILDVTHKRLFTLRTFKNLFDQTGFIILDKKGFPVPFRALGFPDRLCRLLEKINSFLLRIRISLFAYQIMFIVTPLHSPAWGTLRK